MQAVLKILRSIDKGIEKGSSYVLIFAVFNMLLLSVLNIVLRWMGSTLHWVDQYVRHLVFLSTFLGGVLATGRGTHIGIDILGKWCESKEYHQLSRQIGRIIAVASFVTLVWLAKAAWGFVLVEYKYGKPVFWGIHSGILVGIIPFGFSIIAYRFFFLFVKSFFPQEGESA